MRKPAPQTKVIWSKTANYTVLFFAPFINFLKVEFEGQFRTQNINLWLFIRSLDSAPKDAKCDVTSPNGGPKIAHTEEMKKKFTPSEEFGDRRKHVSSARTYFYQVQCFQI